jgi:hypothetical protein
MTRMFYRARLDQNHRNVSFKAYMFDDTNVQIFPLLFGFEDLCFSQEASVNALNTRPPHELLGHEAFHKVSINRSVIFFAGE